MTDHNDPHHIAHTPEELRETLHAHDDWFRRSPDEPSHQSAHGDFNPYVVMISLAVTIVSVILIVILTIGWWDRMAAEERYLVQENNPAYGQEFRGKSDTWRAQLYGEPTWVDERTNTIRIPIDRAMQVIVQEYATAK